MLDIKYPYVYVTIFGVIISSHQSVCLFLYKYYTAPMFTVYRKYYYLVEIIT